MNILYAILFALLLTASYTAFAIPVSSDDPICEGTEEYWITGITPICKKIYDRDYECPSGSYIDFYPAKPICRDDKDRELGDATLKHIPVPTPMPKTESDDEVKKSPASRPENDFTTEFLLFDGLDTGIELIDDNIGVILIVGGAVLGIVLYLIIKRNKPKNYEFKPIQDSPTYDIPPSDVPPTQQPDSRTAYTSKEKSFVMGEPGFDPTPRKNFDPSWNIPIIVIDTNVLFDYAEFNPNNEPVDKETKENNELRYKAIQKYLNKHIKSKTLYVPIKVFDEFLYRTRKMDKMISLIIENRITDISNYVGDDDKMGIEFYNDKNYNKIPGIPRSKEWKANLEKAVEPVLEFYKDIHTSMDSETRRLRKKWELRKRKRDPSASLINMDDNSKNDKKILATSLLLLNYNPGRPIKLLSRDGDFTIFESLISKQFGITVMDAYKFEDWV